MTICIYSDFIGETSGLVVGDSIENTLLNAVEYLYLTEQGGAYAVSSCITYVKN